jgi:hypothetical protein
MPDDAAKNISQVLKQVCRNACFAEPEAKSCILLSAQPECLKQPAARIPVSSSMIKEESEEVGTAGVEGVEESTLCSCGAAAKAAGVGTGKEDSIDAHEACDAHKACAAVAPPSESTETTKGDRRNTQQQQRTEEKKQLQQERKKFKEQQKEKKTQARHEKKREEQKRRQEKMQEEKQGQQLTATEPGVTTAQSDSAITVCRIFAQYIPHRSEAMSLAGDLSASSLLKTILERRESKMSAHPSPGDRNAVKPKGSCKDLYRPRWVGGTWGTELAAKHKLAIYDALERRRNGAKGTEHAVCEHKQCFTPAVTYDGNRSI